MSRVDKVDVGLLFKLRNEYNRLNQLAWSVRELQNRFPLGDAHNEEQLLKNYLALTFDLEDILEELKKAKEEYEDKS